MVEDITQIVGSNAGRIVQYRDRTGTVRRIDHVQVAAEARQSNNSPWDDFLATTPGAALTQSDRWSEAKRALGQRCVSSVTTDTSGELLGGARVILRQVAPGAAIGYVAAGPVLAPGLTARGGWATRVVATMLADARRAGARVLIAQPAEGDSDIAAGLDAAGFVRSPIAVAPEATVRLDLTADDDTLLGAMSSMRRRNIRKALRSGIEVGESTDVEGFWRLHRVSAERQGFEARSLDYLHGQWDALRPGRRVAILEARHDDVAVAAIWLTSFAGTVTFRLPGWDDRLPAPRVVNEALHWAAVQWARAEGAAWYDFGGFDRAAAEQLARGEALEDAFRATHHAFKLGFNPVPTLLPYARIAFTDPILRRAGPAVLPRLLATSWSHRFAARWRNG